VTLPLEPGAAPGPYGTLRQARGRPRACGHKAFTKGIGAS